MSYTLVTIYILVCLISFFAAAIPTGKIIIWKVKKIDLQKFGSKNTGTTNVYRAAGLQWATLVFFLDFCKGFIPLLLTWFYLHDTLLTLTVGICAILGNIFSPFLNFKGGKGVAVATGACFFLFHLIILISLLFWYIILKITKRMSLATFAGLAMCTILVLLLRGTEYKVFMVCVAILILFSHRNNIKRLLNGEELSVHKIP
jgi:acyl phosphate:glycerol-3-phosphate acyltransferase